jgi:predicted nuclease of predicted toxin-antitoxin system
MRLLLDENLPKRLKADFPDHEVFTARERGWNGLKNGELLQQLLDNEFDCLLTFDKNLKHQQNFQKYTIAVFALSAGTNTYEDLTKLSPRIKEYLKKRALPQGVIAISGD